MFLQQLDAQQFFAARERTWSNERRRHLASYIARRRGALTITWLDRCAERYSRGVVPADKVRDAVRMPATTTVPLGDPGQHPRGRVAGVVEDAVLILLIILFVPAAVLVVGTPVVLLVRALLAVVARF
jgi:hypothetical protein